MPPKGKSYSKSSNPGNVAKELSSIITQEGRKVMPSSIKKSRVKKQGPKTSHRKRASLSEVSSSLSKKRKSLVAEELQNLLDPQAEEPQDLLDPQEERLIRVDTCLEEFVKCFVSDLAGKIQSYHNSLSKNIKKPGKSADIFAQSVKSVTMAGMIPGVNVALAAILSALPSACGSNYHRKQVKKLLSYLYMKQKPLLKTLVESGCKIFQSFENQFVQLISDQSRQRAMEKLADEGVDRVINYLEDSKEEFSTSLVINGFILGESKRGRNYLGFPKKYPGHELKFKDSDVRIQDLIGKVGLIVVDDENNRHYYAKKGGNGEYGFRYFSKYEEGGNPLPDGKLTVNGQDYEEVDPPTENQDYLLTDEVLEEKQKEILEMFKEPKDYLKEILEKTNEILATRSSKDQERESIWFHMTKPVNFFTERENKLSKLHEKLHKEGKQKTEISQMVSVTGLKGTGKSELARHYAYEKREYYDNNVIWINAKTEKSLEESFKELAEKLQITIKEDKGKIESIVKDVYEYFKNTKSLFIFDSAEEYENIKRFLPSSLSPAYKAPYFLITSNTEKWEVGDEGKIEMIRLDGFEKGEAVGFVKKALNIKDNRQDQHIEKLAEELKHFPLALKRATQIICKKNKRLMKMNQGKVTVAKYLDDFKQDKQAHLFNFKPDKSSGDRYEESMLEAWKVTRNCIKQNGNIGKKALEILYRVCTAGDSIDFSDSDTLSAGELLEQHSIIYVKDGKINVRGLVGKMIELKEKRLLSKASDKVDNNPEAHLSSTRVDKAVSVQAMAST